MAKGSLRVNGIIVDTDGEIKASTGDSIVIREDDGSAVITVDTNGKTSIGGAMDVGVDDTGYDVKLFGDTASRYWLWDTSADGVVQRGTLTVGVDDTGHDVKFFGATAGKSWLWDESADKMIITGDTQLTGTLTVGVDNTGHDVKFFGATASKYWLWDESADQTVLVGSSTQTGNAQLTGTLTVGVDDTGYDITFYGATAGAKMVWEQATDHLFIRGGPTNPGKLVLQTAETTVVDGNKLGQIDFQAPLDSAGTDAILVGASIYAEADATFSSSVNATELVFATGASEAAAEKMRITSDGKVGIGTTAPGVKLEVTGAADGKTIKMNHDYPGLLFYQTHSNSGARNWAIQGGPSVHGSLQFYVSAAKDGDPHGGNHVMSLSSAGNVGIGTATPTSPIGISSFLHIAGSSHAGIVLDDTGTSGNWEMYSADDYLTFVWNDSVEAIRFLADGKVGIGTTTPLGKIHVWTASGGGSVTYNAAVDELALENSGDCGMTIMSGATNNGAIWFGKTGDTGKGRIDFDQNNGKMSLWTANTERLSILTGGNVGIGVTPQADWVSTRTGLQIGPRTCIWGESSNNNSLWSHNVYETSSGYAGIADGPCTFFVMSAGEMNYRNGTNSAGAGGAVSMTTRLAIDSSGKVGIGIAAPAYKLDVQSTVSADEVVANFENDINASGEHALIRCGHGSLAAYMGQYLTTTDVAYFSGDADPANLKGIYITNTTGYVGIGTAAPAYALDISTNVASWTTEFENTNASAYGITIYHPNGSNNTTQMFLSCQTASTAKLRIYTDGSVQNVDGTYGSALSDERLKINIKDANSQWEDVKNINIVNYKRLVDGADSRSLLSVIAQQVKEVSPGLIGERPPDSEEIKANPTFGTLYKEGDDIPEGKEIGDIKEIKEEVLFFKDSIFFWKCAKALQEAMVKIETLETKVTALESA